ncbi:hypothetical protein BJ741DRAFT_604554 [Chytriomyces cf. hyalinus JEL632]|nr:hypothetical protein BJ741DRAFT_604554 [Chytriomyces cf. hyalinus JEL632]
MAFSMQQQMQQQQQQQQQQMQQMQHQQQQHSFWSAISPALVPVLAPMLTALANRIFGELPALGNRGNAGQFPVHASNTFSAQPPMQDLHDFHAQPAYNDFQRQPHYNNLQRHPMQPAPQSRDFDAFNSISPLFRSGAGPSHQDAALSEPAGSEWVASQGVLL